MQAMISINEVLVATEEETSGNLNDVADHALNAGIVADPAAIRVWIAAMRDRGSNFESIVWSLQESSRPAGVAGKPDGATGMQVFDENNRAVPVSKLIDEGFLKGRLNPLEFMDEYAAVMNRYVKIEVRNRFKEGGVDLSLNFGSGDGWLLWLEDGQYCFDEKERGKVRTGGLFNSQSIELTQIVMLNCTVPYLRHALGFSSLSVPSTVDELPVGWSVTKTASACYKSMRGPTGELLEFVTWNPAHCVPLAWFYGVSPSELLHAYMLPDGGPLLRRWLGRPYIR